MFGQATTRRSALHPRSLSFFLTEDDIDYLVNRLKILPKGTMQKVHHAAQSVLDEDPPEKFNHLDNPVDGCPFKSKFGPDWWEQAIDRAALGGKVCVTELIEHMVKATKAALDGSEDFHICHDALQQLFETKTREWMKERGYLDKFIFPVAGLLDWIHYCHHWWYRPPGNSPDLMPLDASLNKDLHDGVRRNCQATSHLDDADPRKFSMKDTKMGLDACLRTWELVPSSKRILEDIDGVFESMHFIVAAEGVAIPGRADRPGHRFIPKGGRGGRRVKGSGQQPVVVLAPEAESSQETRMSVSAAMCPEELSDLEEEGSAEDGSADGSDGAVSVPFSLSSNY